MTIVIVPPVGVVTAAPSGAALESPPPPVAVPPGGTFPVVATGGALPPCGVTEAEGADGRPGPALFDAVTVNVYASPFANPVTEALVPTAPTGCPSEPVVTSCGVTV